MSKIKDSKKIYDSIKEPCELNNRVRYAINNKDQDKKTNQSYKVLAMATSICLLFVLAITTNKSLGGKLANIPIFSSIFTTKQIKKESQEDIIDVKIPAISSLSDKSFEEKVNHEILIRIEKIIEQNEKEALASKEDYEKYAKQENIKEEFKPVRYTIDYVIKSNQDDILSFEILQTQESETLKYFYTESYIYNIDLKNSKELTLKDILGENYKTIANREINKQIDEMKKDEYNMFFERENNDYITDYAEDSSVKKDYQFYINNKGNLVIIFDKYSIAPGYMGKLEFEIETN